MQGTHTGAVCEELHPREGLTLENLGRTVSCERDLTVEQGKSVRCPPPEDEGAAEATCDELTTRPIPCPSVPLWGEEAEKSGVKLSLGRREGWG